MVRLIVLFAAMVALLGGCVASKTVVTVAADGSAAVEQVAYWKPMEMMMGDAAGGGAAAAPAGGGQIDPEQLKAQCEAYAKRMGEGVTLKSVEILKAQGVRQGAKVVYAVADINQLKLDMIPDIGPITSQDDGPKCRFEFEKTAAGGKLAILVPPPQQPPGQQAAMKPEEEAMALMLMGPMLEGVVIEMQVQFAGTITKSNAKYVTPRRDTLTLVRANLNALGKDRVAMKEFMALQKVTDPQEMMKKIQAPPISRHVQIEPAERVEVEFKAGAAPRPAPVTPAPIAADPATPRVPAAADTPSDAKARSALVLAKNYVLNKRPDIAREKFQAIINQYPGTPYADEAQKALSELPPPTEP